MKFEQYLTEAKAKKMTRAELQAEISRLDKLISAGQGQTSMMNRRLWMANMFRLGMYRGGPGADNDDENDDFDTGDVGGDFDGGDGGGE